MFLRADAEGGLAGGLAYDANYLDAFQAQQLSDNFQVSLLQNTCLAITTQICIISHEDVGFHHQYTVSSSPWSYCI